MNASCMTHVDSFRPARLAGWGVLGFWLGSLGLVAVPVHAMGPEQVATLPNSSLLDMRVDAVFRKCGLPAAIDDSADSMTKRQALRWGATPMYLSPQAWTLRYSRKPVTKASEAWRHPQAGSLDCLTGLSELVIRTKGEAGFLVVKKRPDHNGYTTTYTVPDNLFSAHQVVAITGSWQEERTAATILKTFGKPDEILEASNGVRYRYWIVKRENKMPLSAQAVDFEVTHPENSCRTFTVQNNGVEFVQEKLDTLIRQWERVYVLD